MARMSPPSCLLRISIPYFAPDSISFLFPVSYLLLIFTTVSWIHFAWKATSNHPFFVQILRLIFASKIPICYSVPTRQKHRTKLHFSTMKLSLSSACLLAIASLAAAQDLTELPACAVCIPSSLAQSSSFAGQWRNQC